MAGDGAIVVGGEALVDLVLVGASRQLTAHEGGGPYNTARTLGRLGRPVHWLGALSTDAFGTRLRAGLEADGVRLDTAARTTAPTTLAVAELDAAGSARYAFYTAGTSAPALEPDRALALMPDAVAMLHVGTLGLVLEPLAGALRAVVGAVADDVLVMVDPNCRPSAIADRAAYRERLTATLRRTDVLKVSAEDLQWLDPSRPALDAARALLAEGPRAALVTDGAAGAHVVTATGTEHVPAPRARVVDTVGAGDAFSGGFLAWWGMRGLGRADVADRAAVLEATRFGCAVAARTCERAGASPPRLAELDPAA